LDHAPERFDRRAGMLSANLSGSASTWATLRHRVNGGPWQPLVGEPPRTPGSRWTLEILPDELRAGANWVEIEASAWARQSVRVEHLFHYDPTAPSLPMVQRWNGPLDVQDGQWEVIDEGGERRVRPVPGTEGYDAILLASGAFAGGRRVETEMTFRDFMDGPLWAGFGVLTLWGGHDDLEHRPRRGWRYAVAWYMKPYGAWCEFSLKAGDGPRHDVFMGETWKDIEPDSRWSLIAESWPEVDAEGEHLRHHQRMKLWPTGSPEPAEWLEVHENADARLPPGEYAVAVITHQAQVEFGPVRITPLPPAAPPPPVEEDDTQHSIIVASEGADP
jgi:hypothetical protein